MGNANNQFASVDNSLDDASIDTPESRHCDIDDTSSCDSSVLPESTDIDSEQSSSVPREIHQVPVQNHSDTPVPPNPAPNSPPHYHAGISFSPIETARALEAKGLHESLGHPHDNVLERMLDKGEIQGCHLNGKDLQNARKIYGKCQGCIIGKMKSAPTPQISSAPPSPDMGTQWSADFVFIKGSAAGKKVPYLIFTEAKSDLDVVFKHKGRSTAEVKLTGRRLKRFIDNNFHLPADTKKVIKTDHEPVLRKLEHAIDWCEVQQSSPDGFSKKSERKIQTLKSKMNAVLANLEYKLPDFLYPSLFEDVVKKNSYISSKQSGDISPAKKALGKTISFKDIARAKFGAIVAAQIPPRQRKGNISPKADLGIIVGFENSNPRNLKVFIPSSRQIVTRANVQFMPGCNDVIHQMNDLAKNNDGSSPILEDLYDIEERQNASIASAASTFLQSDNQTQEYILNSLLQDFQEHDNISNVTTKSTMSPKEAFQLFPAELANAALDAEIDNIDNANTWTVVHPQQAYEHKKKTNEPINLTI